VSFARQRICKHVTATANTRNNRRTVGRFIFYAVHVVSKESRRLVLPKLLVAISLIAMGSDSPVDPHANAQDRCVIIFSKMVGENSSEIWLSRRF
jgi:hypothetical protein